MSGRNDKGVGTRHPYAPKTHDNQHADFASDQGTSKAFATVQAELAMRNYGLYEIADQDHFVSRWNCSHQLPDLHAVRAMLMQIGGRQ